MKSIMCQFSSQFNHPGRYLIEVSGTLRPLEVEETIGGTIVDVWQNGGSRTILDVIVKDQSHLSGVLNTLFEWHHTIYSVKYLTDVKENE